MKKVIFYKTMYGGKGQPPKIETATGYRQLYTVTGTDIEISLIFEKREFEWAITEEKSGFLVKQDFPTRKAAEESVTPELLKMIADKLPTLNDYITVLNIHRMRSGEVI